MILSHYIMLASQVGSRLLSNVNQLNLTKSTPPLHLQKARAGDAEGGEPALAHQPVCGLHEKDADQFLSGTGRSAWSKDSRMV